MTKTIIERVIYIEVDGDELLAARILPSEDAGYLKLILSPNIADTNSLEHVEATLSKECAKALAEALLDSVKEIA